MSIKIIAIIIIINVISKSCYCSSSIGTAPQNDASAYMPWRLPEDYDSNKDPFGYQNLSTIKLPWTYTFENWVKEITRVDDKRQRISFMMYFKVEWQEPRVKINLNSTMWRDDHGNKREWLALPLNTDIWVPDLEINGLRNFNTKSVLKDMAGLKLRTSKNLKNGRVKYIPRLIY